MRRTTTPAMPISRSVGWKLSHGEEIAAVKPSPIESSLSERSAPGASRKACASLSKGYTNRDTEDSAKEVFSCSSLHAPIFDLYFLPVNGAVFRFLCRLFLRLGQPLPDGGLFLTAHFPAGKLLKCRCDGICVPAFEKDQVTGLLCGGVFLQGKIHMVFLRHTGESLDILVTDLDIGKTGVLVGKLFKALPAAVDFGLLAFLDFLQELFDLEMDNRIFYYGLIIVWID